MATITGTPWDDFLSGTYGDDEIRPLGGVDIVDGGLGRDRLIIDYSSDGGDGNPYWSIVTLDRLGLAGWITSPNSKDQTLFRNIEDLNVVMGNANDTFFVTMQKPLNQERMTIDAGGGQHDRLILSLENYGDFRFAAAPDGTVATDLVGTFRGFEEFTMFVRAGQHTITTGAGQDYIALSGGDTLLSTGAGADGIDAMAGKGRIWAGDGDDTIRTAGMSGSIDGGAGTDLWMVDFADRTSSSFLTFDGRTGAGWTGSKEGEKYSYGRVTATGMEKVNVRFGAGDDTVKLTAAEGSVSTGAGDDMIWLSQPGQSRIDAGSGTDTLVADLSTYSPDVGVGVSLFAPGDGGWNGYFGPAAVFSVEHVSVKLTGNSDSASVVCAPLLQGARLSLAGGDGTDMLQLDFTGFSGVTFRPDDTGTARVAGAVFSGFEVFTVLGSAGNDVLKGGNGNDQLIGGAGDDQLYATPGNDQLIGGKGNDTYFMGDDTGCAIYELPDEGIDSVYATGSYALPENVERLYITGTASAQVVGNASGNLLVGNAGDDLLVGADGKDTLQGGAGNDELAGGAGADTLTGGAGADLFTFNTLETSAERDIIKDFTPGEDNLLFYPTVFSALQPAATDPAARGGVLAIGAQATTADQHLVYDPNSGGLFYDADGAGGQQQVLIAVLANKPTITIDSFIIG